MEHAPATGVPFKEGQVPRSMSMAEIPVQRKGTPWWVYAIVLFVGVVIIWAIIRERDQTEMAAVPPVSTTATAERAENAAEIDRLEMVWNTSDAQSLIGKTVQIPGAGVLSVT